MKTKDSLPTSPGLLPDLTWVKFQKDWLTFWKTVTKHPFTYKWVNSKCAVVAWRMHQFLGEGRERYGFFDGEITNPYWLGKSSGFVRHGWLEVNGCIVDPTRWCFLRTHTPMLAICNLQSRDYDAGMNVVRQAMWRPLPEYNANKMVLCYCPAIMDLFEGQVCKERLFWLANLAVGDPVFGTEEIRVKMFTWLQDNGYQAWIPWDNRV